MRQPKSNPLLGLLTILLKSIGDTDSDTVKKTIGDTNSGSLLKMKSSLSAIPLLAIFLAIFFKLMLIKFL
jgi:hypothetical protein